MTLRTRLTLWYALIFSGSLLIIGVAMYADLVVEQRHKMAHHPTAGVDEDAGEDITQIILLYGGTAAAIGLLGGWWFTRRAFAPVADLTAAVEKIHEGNLGEKLPRTGNGDELDRLTEVFNDMTARLGGAFQRVREFTLHASHELKTPLTIIHAELETELGSGQLAAAQRERLASQLDEVQRLTKIVDGLSLLTKADAGQVSLSLEPLALDEIVRDVFADALILGKPANLSIRLTLCEPVKINGDKHRLRQLLLNLADNAVKYNQPGGRIEFSLQRTGENAQLEISNTSKNIPPEILPRLFERFFRGVPPHDSAAEGCGLGLSIAQWIVTAHSGDIAITSAENTTRVRVRLPCAGGIL